MRQFARPFPMDRLSLEARVLYSAFLVFIAIGVGTSAWLYDDDGLGLGSDDVVVYFHGDEARPAAPAPPAAGGLQLDLPEDASATTTMRLQKPARQVVETFHFHAFTMPVVLLIIGHIFMMAALSTRKKIIVLLLSSTSTLLHLLLPPLVRFAGAFWAALFAPSAIVMTLSWLVLIVWPLWEMWRPARFSPSTLTSTAGPPDAESTLE